MKRGWLLLAAVALVGACGSDPSAGDVAPDKTTRKIGFIRSIDTGRRVIEIDFAEFLTGEAAQAAYREEYGAEATLDGDYYVSNPKTTTVEVKLFNDTPISVNILGGYSPTDNHGVSLKALRELFDDKTTRPEALSSLFWIRYDKDRRATRVEQQYVP